MPRIAPEPAADIDHAPRRDHPGRTRFVLRALGIRATDCHRAVRRSRDHRLVRWLSGTTLESDHTLRRLSDRKSVVSGKSVSVRVDLGGRRIIKKKTSTQQTDKIQ